MDIYDCLDFLNKTLELDRNLVNQLINYRVPINDNILNHPSITIATENDQDVVGLLGILNGLFGHDKIRLGAVLNDDNTIREFKVMKKHEGYWT